MLECLSQKLPSRLEIVSNPVPCWHFSPQALSHRTHRFFRADPAITTKQQRVQRRNEALQLIADGVPPTDAATRLTVKWGCSRRTSLRDIELAQSELANAKLS